ncbi:hypothetical protein L3Q82_015579 [Scortum barcoo]|uniref:Uncharacterized protein n=1 Tax=Scortum barcoo TaxID=214431 RepID=A0ACB8VN45_9TELE|nr:hypothetical protein L3Q82_015579 [Scortum barcoo]
MSSPIHLRVVFGGDDARKLTLMSGIPTSVDQLVLEIKTAFGLTQQFRLQYKDADFGNEYVNLMSTSEIKDRDTLKVVFFACEETSSSIPGTVPPCSTSTPMPSPTTSHSSVNPLSSPSLDRDSFSSDHSFGSADTIILDPVPESRTSSWPQVFIVPNFSYFAEIQLQRANAEFIANGTLPTPQPKLRMDILEGMAEQIFRYTAYPSDSQIEEAAEVLVHAHPCLRERGTRVCHEGWKQYLKTKVANFRTKLCKIGHPEVAVNSLKNKRKGQEKAAANIKKPRKAEVNFLPSLPSGETRESLENERVALLTEVKKRNNAAVVKKKMQKTFSYRRQEVVQDSPLISEFVNRWPALFTVSESEDIEVKRDCVLRSLCVYLNEDSNTLIKEYLNVNSEEAEREIAQTTMGLYVIQKDGADDKEKPEDVGVVIEGVEVLCKLGSISFGCAMLFELIYILNLSYPQELKFTFEFFQKVLMNLDGNKLSPKVQTLKIKMLQ